MTVNNLLRDRIKRLANQRDMSIPDLEKVLGFGSGTISHWNKVCPNTDKLLLVSDFLEVSVDYLLRGYEFTPNDPETEVELSLIKMFRSMSDEGKEYILLTARMASEKFKKSTDVSDSSLENA